MFADADDVRSKLVELPLEICCKCEEVDRVSQLHLVERIQAVLSGADHKACELFDQWKKLV
jgi:hypothetical protein